MFNLQQNASHANSCTSSNFGDLLYNTGMVDQTERAQFHTYQNQVGCASSRLSPVKACANTPSCCPYLDSGTLGRVRPSGCFSYLRRNAERRHLPLPNLLCEFVTRNIYHHPLPPIYHSFITHYHSRGASIEGLPSAPVYPESTARITHMSIT